MTTNRNTRVEWTQWRNGKFERISRKAFLEVDGGERCVWKVDGRQRCVWKVDGGEKCVWKVDGVREVVDNSCIDTTQVQHSFWSLTTVI